MFWRLEIKIKSGDQKAPFNTFEAKRNISVTPVGCSRCSARSLTSPQQQVWGICGVACAATVKWEFGHPEHPLPGVFVYFTEGWEEDRGDLLIQSLTQSLTASAGVLPAASVVLQRTQQPRVRHQLSLAVPSGAGGPRPTLPHVSSRPRPAKGSCRPDGRIVQKIQAFADCPQALRWQVPAAGILPLAPLRDSPANTVSQDVTVLSLTFCVHATFRSGPGTSLLGTAKQRRNGCGAQAPGWPRLLLRGAREKLHGISVPPTLKQQKNKSM